MKKDGAGAGPPDSGASSIELGPADDSSGFFTPLWESKAEPGSGAGEPGPRQNGAAGMAGQPTKKPAAPVKRMRMPMPTRRPPDRKAAPGAAPKGPVGGARAQPPRTVSKPPATAKAKLVSPEAGPREAAGDTPAVHPVPRRVAESAADLSVLVEQPGQLAREMVGEAPRGELLHPESSTPCEPLSGAGLLRQLRRTLELTTSLPEK